ncbi:MAG: hypothetical protein ACYCSO_08290 [Cuniculiplasma sp.]
MKCPVCGNTEGNKEYKEWMFNSYRVTRYQCGKCGANFNYYSGESGDYTIPKPKEMK